MSITIPRVNYFFFFIKIPTLIEFIWLTICMFGTSIRSHVRCTKRKIHSIPLNCFVVKINKFIVSARSSSQFFRFVLYFEPWLRLDAVVNSLSSWLFECRRIGFVTGLWRKIGIKILLLSIPRMISILERDGMTYVEQLRPIHTRRERYWVGVENPTPEIKQSSLILRLLSLSLSTMDEE